MKCRLFVALALVCCAAPSLMAQLGSSSSDHIEVGAFADFFNLSRTSPHINYVRVGGRAGFNVHNNQQIEAEIAYNSSAISPLHFPTGSQLNWSAPTCGRCTRSLALNFRPAAPYLCSGPSKLG